MRTLKGAYVYLRALEPEDLEFVHEIENNQDIWEISNTIAPYSKFLIKQYLEQAYKDVFEAKQLRLVISDYNDRALGLIDLFDFDHKHRRAGVGILIKDLEDRQKGFGKEALDLLISYCRSHLDLHQLYCNISEENTKSLKLFKSKGFETVGLKKDWNYSEGSYKNEYLLQLLFK